MFDSVLRHGKKYDGSSEEQSFILKYVYKNIPLAKKMLYYSNKTLLTLVLCYVLMYNN